MSTSSNKIHQQTLITPENQNRKECSTFSGWPNLAQFCSLLPNFTAQIVIFTLVISMNILLSLPDELCRLVLFDWCFLKDIAKLDQAYLCRTSRIEFLAIASDNTRAFTHDLNEVKSQITQRKIIEWLVSRSIRVKHLSIGNIESDVKLVTDFFQGCGSSLLEVKIQNTRYKINDDFLSSLLTQHCGNLQELSLTESFSDSLNFLHMVSLRCPSICKLTLEDCVGYSGALSEELCFSALRIFESRYTPLSSSFLANLAVGSPLLESISLEGTAFIIPTGFHAIADNCPLLHTVALAGECVTDLSLLPLVKQCRNLHTIEITKVHRYFSNDSLRYIAQYCPLLTTFRLENCCDVTTSGVKEVLTRCKALRKLSFGGCRGISVDHALIAIAELCPFLTHLCVLCPYTYFGQGLTFVAPSCTYLQRVTLTTNRLFQHLSPRTFFGAHVQVDVIIDSAAICEEFVEFNGYDVRL